MSSLETLIKEWRGLGVLTQFDPDTSSWIFIALHDDTLGAPVGGTRLKHYATPADGLRDAQRLAEGMTHKWAAIGLDSGGGKAVLAVPERFSAESRHRLLSKYAALLNTLSGAFATGRDLGTTDDDMRALRKITPYVHGVDIETNQARDPGPWTARGVFAALRAAVRHLDGRSDLGGLTVLIQGIGAAGAPLARRVAAAGASLILSDVDTKRATELAAELDAQTVLPQDVFDTTCDVYSPCAVGGVLSESTISRLKCRAVVGSANNQLAELEDAERLHERGILYAPDYVTNGGGALAFGLISRGVDDVEELERRVDGLEHALDEIFRQSASNAESPVHAARRRVQRQLNR